ncbi:MAG: heme o synthase [Chloroflexi bacterium]|nr:heme o synthase [Chloroflexota bacterium]
MIAHVAASRSVVRDYVALSKPRIVLLLLFTALAGMFLASGGPPELTLTIVVLGGGAMASAGANALNQFLDRDIDARMHRTSNRPVATNRVHPREALLFGVGLNIVAFVLFTTLVNPLSAVLTLTATLFYVFVYTIALKRTTPQNIVIGGAAGALPPMIGWAAVTGSLGLPAVYLFAIIFFWTPPHFWALSLLLKDDYARARVPMLPVVAGVTQTKRSIFLYTLMLLALTSMFFTTEAVGWIYFGASIILGLLFIYYAWRLLKRPGIEGAVGTYVYSLVYLALLFTAIMVDASLGG